MLAWRKSHSIVKSKKKTRGYILRRDKAKWAKELDKAIKQTDKELDAKEKTYETFVRKEDKEDFEKSILARAEKRHFTGEKAGELREKLIEDVREHLDDE